MNHNHDEDGSSHADICYERVASSVGSLDDERRLPRAVLMNFIIMSVLLSCNHGAAVSCLAFATLELGSTGAWQSCLFHICYAVSSLMGATYVVKRFGPRNSMAMGMACYGIYVGCFSMAVQWRQYETPLALLGALGGGVGGALVWTAQGSYFGRAAQEYAIATQQNEERATSLLGGVFAFVYLALEVGAKLLSWSILRSSGSGRVASWNAVLFIYTAVALVSTVGMVVVRDYPSFTQQEDFSVWYKVSAAWRLLVGDTKMRYMVGLNAAFGFATPFVNSYVNGEVVHVVLSKDRNLHYVGLFSAVTSAVGAICSLVFASVSQRLGKGPILIVGSLAFGLVALPFITSPHVNLWSYKSLLAVYAFQGIGRSTFEGTLRATFADYFPVEQEGAFANIILQSGGFTALGFFLSFGISCHKSGDFCIEYKEGTLHEILTLELMVMVSAVLAVLGCWRASVLFAKEQRLLLSIEEDEGGSFIEDTSSEAARNSSKDADSESAQLRDHSC